MSNYICRTGKKIAVEIALDIAAVDYFKDAL